jgi:hypothetical protein
MKGNFHSLVLVSILLVGTACNASQVSGTYVAHASTFAEMLQLTQTSDGQISGVLSHVELKSDGSGSSEQSPVNGTADAGQLTSHPFATNASATCFRAFRQQLPHQKTFREAS